MCIVLVLNFEGLMVRNALFTKALAEATCTWMMAIEEISENGRCLEPEMAMLKLTKQLTFVATLIISVNMVGTIAILIIQLITPTA